MRNQSISRRWLGSFRRVANSATLVMHAARFDGSCVETSGCDFLLMAPQYFTSATFFIDDAGSL